MNDAEYFRRHKTCGSVLMATGSFLLIGSLLGAALKQATKKQMNTGFIAGSCLILVGYAVYARGFANLYGRDPGGRRYPTANLTELIEGGLNQGLLMINVNTFHHQPQPASLPPIPLYHEVAL